MVRDFYNNQLPPRITRSRHAEARDEYECVSTGNTWVSSFYKDGKKIQGYCRRR